MIAEIIGGYMANSLAIMTDAAHLLSDLAGFLISISALWLANKTPTSRLSFGFHRAEILGALVSVLLIWLLTGVLVYEATLRVMNPEPVDGKIMFIVASAGFACNLIMGCILAAGGHGHSHGLSIGGDDHGHSHGGEPKKSKGHGHSHGGNGNAKKSTDHGHSHGSEDHGHSHGAGEEHDHDDHDEEAAHDDHDDEEETDPVLSAQRKQTNINVRAALIHVIGDAIQAIGVMIAAAVIWYHPDAHIADPICTFLFSILVLFTTIRLIRQSVGVLMEGSPDGIVPNEVQVALQNIPGVIEVHDLHIWSLTVGKPALSVHMLADGNGVLEKATRLLAGEYNIHHATIQVEQRVDKVQCNPIYGGKLPGHTPVAESYQSA